MQIDLTRGSVAGSMLRFSLPLIAGNLLQQCYNITDTFIVSRISSDALAAVGTSYSVMTFLTSVILGLCMGSGILFSMLFGAKKQEELKKSVVKLLKLTGENYQCVITMERSYVGR